MFSKSLKNTGTFEYDDQLHLNIYRNVYPVFERVLARYRTEKYSIEGAPDPAVLSTILYDNPEYYWILLLVNDVTDPFEEWIISDQAVQKIAAQLYDNVNEIHHYEDSSGNFYYDIVENNNVYYDVGDTSFSKPFYDKGPLLPVTNVEYELNKNEEKRSIRIIPPEIINSFVNDLKKEFDLDVQ